MTEFNDVRAKEIAERLAELDEMAGWGKADYLVKEFPAEEWGRAEHGANTGLYEALYKVSKELSVVWGIEHDPKYLAGLRATAIIYPDTERSVSASFDVHQRCRKPEELKKHLRRAEKEGLALTATRLSQYRQDERGSKPLAPFEERFARRIDSLLRREILGPGRTIKQDDWWNTKHADPETRKDAARILRSIADEIQP